MGYVCDEDEDVYAITNVTVNINDSLWNELTYNGVYEPLVGSGSVIGNKKHRIYLGKYIGYTAYDKDDMIGTI